MAEIKNLILDKNQILQKIKRIAYQIYEENFQQGELVFAGIQGAGYTLAQMIRNDFEEISGLTSKLCMISLDKFQPVQGEINIDIEIAQIRDKTVIVVDDVLNTGRTMAYSLSPFLTIRISKLPTAVLVDRNHKSFPVSADFVGYTLSTTLQEHITVVLENNEDFGVYLS